MKPDWRTIQCHGCGGHGVVAVYSYYDFEGADFCDVCGGAGYVFIRPTGHLFLHPGGPACGMGTPTDYQRGTPYAALDEKEEE